MCSVISGVGLNLNPSRTSSYKHRFSCAIKMLKRDPTDENLSRDISIISKINKSDNFHVKALVSAIAAVDLVAIDTAKALPIKNIMEGAASVSCLADINLGDWLGGFLYSAGQQANEAVQEQLPALSFTSLAVIFGAGLVTSLSPCTLSVLPLTLGYIGAFGSGKSRAEIIGNSVAFFWIGNNISNLRNNCLICWKSLWTDRARTAFGCFRFAILMGLNLLEVVELQLPSLFNNFDPRAAAANFPSSVQAYLAGLTFALAASPCSTPVLASVLGYVAASRVLLNLHYLVFLSSFFLVPTLSELWYHDISHLECFSIGLTGDLVLLDPVIGGSLLLTYSTGYVAPILLAASFAGALQSLLSFRKFSAWINPMSGALLLGGGLYTLLDRLFPTTMAI